MQVISNKVEWKNKIETNNRATIRKWRILWMDFIVFVRVINTNVEEGSLQHFPKYLSSSEKFAHLNFLLIIQCDMAAMAETLLYRATNTKFSHEMADNKSKIILNKIKMYGKTKINRIFITTMSKQTKCRIFCAATFSFP